jgi:hypothetical protein
MNLLELHLVRSSPLFFLSQPLLDFFNKRRIHKAFIPSLLVINADDLSPENSTTARVRFPVD